MDKAAGVNPGEGAWPGNTGGAYVSERIVSPGIELYGL
jgi:hypothetical protein